MTRSTTTRLKILLLAGTILPAFSLAPLAPLSAQDGDRGERAGQRQHEGGGPRGEGQGRREGGGRAERQGGEGRRGGPAARENAQGEPANGPKARAGDEAPRGEGRRKGQEQGQGAGQGEKARAGRGENADEPRGGRKAAEDGGRAAPGNRAQQREERKERRETVRDRDEGGPRQGERREGERKGGDRTHAGERNDKARENRAGENRAGDRDRAGDREDRRRDNPDRAGGERRRGDPERAEDRRNDNRTRAGDRDRPNERMRGDRDRDDRPRPGERDERRFGGPAGPGGPGGGPGGPGGPGFAGGFMAPTQARRLDDVRRDRREVREGDRVFIREPGRTIVQDRGRAFIVHDETDRFRALGLNVRREQRGGQAVDIIVRPGGEQILTYTDGSGRMLRRVRRMRDGREVVLIDNAVGGRVGAYADDVVVLPPPPLRIPRDRYIVDYRGANANVLYDTLSAPPLAAPPRRYTLDQVRYSPDVRNYVRSVDINTINFDTGSWEVPAAASGKLEALATAINRSVDRNPNSVFLIEGYTDATGNPDDNLSLSDRRAQSVAEILTKDFKVPPENLTTQGYGQQNPKENTQGPSEANRRVVVRNITQLLAAGDEPAPAGR